MRASYSASMLRNYSISRRLILILLVSIVVLAALGGMLLALEYKDIYSDRAERTHQLVDSAAGVLGYFRDQEVAGS